MFSECSNAAAEWSLSAQATEPSVIVAHFLCQVTAHPTWIAEGPAIAGPPATFATHLAPAGLNHPGAILQLIGDFLNAGQDMNVALVCPVGQL